MFSLALFHITADATICHGNNLNCFSVNSTVLNDFLPTGGTDDIGPLLHVISSRFLIMFCMFLLADCSWTRAILLYSQPTVVSQFFLCNVDLRRGEGLGQCYIILGGSEVLLYNVIWGWGVKKSAFLCYIICGRLLSC